MKAQQILRAMNTCDTCTHWDRSPDGHVNDCPASIPARQRECKHERLCYVTSEAACISDKPVVDCWRSLPDDGLGYYDTEDYNAVLATGPKFGCIHHEPACLPGTPEYDSIMQEQQDIMKSCGVEP